MKLKILSPLVFLVTIFVSSAASAQVDRGGLMIGLGVGASFLHDKDFLGDGEDSNLGFGGQFYVGGSLTPEFAIMGLYDFHAGVETVGDTDVSIINVFLGPAAQYTLMDRFWFRAGPGVTMTRAEAEVDFGGVTVSVGDDRSGFGALLGAGVEVLQMGKFAMDVNFRAIPQWYKSEDGGFAATYAGGLGFTWY